jgi:hypothetical protein
MTIWRASWTPWLKKEISFCKKRNGEMLGSESGMDCSQRLALKNGLRSTIRKLKDQMNDTMFNYDPKFRPRDLMNDRIFNCDLKFRTGSWPVSQPIEVRYASRTTTIWTQARIVMRCRCNRRRRTVCRRRGSCWELGSKSSKQLGDINN